MKFSAVYGKYREKNTVRYFLLIVLVLAFLFFSGDFGLVNVQKTAIVMAVGVDREDDDFIVTSQIAVPQASTQGQGQGKSAQTVQIVSRGKTVSQAFSQINAKTGWYPKLVFCHLIVLGNETAKNNVFDALDFFLLDEYMPDSCLIATSDGAAKDLLNVSALIDSSGSVAMQKVLSDHAQRVGLVLSCTLREFAIGYASESKSGYLPVLKTQPQQEEAPAAPASPSSPTAASSSSSSSDSGSTGGGKEENKPVFSARETALFVDGKRVGTLSESETFAFNAVKNDLQLASYSVTDSGKTCTLNVRHNAPKTKFSIDAEGKANLKISLTLTAGLSDYSKAQSPDSLVDAGDVPAWAFPRAEKLLAAQIKETFEKCRACKCDLFELSSFLQKYENARFDALKSEILSRARLDISVRFRGVR